MQNGTKDRWDKLDIILRPVGGFLTAFAVAYVGILGSQYLKRREATETDRQLYIELLSKRQERDTAFRRDMLKPEIEAVQAIGGPIQTKMLNMELLAANFQESLDLGPLLKVMDQQVRSSTTPRKDEYKRRIEIIAQSVKTRQLVTVGGQQVSGDFVFDSSDLQGPPTIDQDMRLPSEDLANLPQRHFRVDVLEVDPVSQQANVRLTVTERKDKRKQGFPELDVLFWVSRFDFPMSNNFSLSHASRCAVLFQDFYNSGHGGAVKILLAYFPEPSEDPVQVLKSRLAEVK